MPNLGTSRSILPPLTQTTLAAVPGSTGTASDARVTMTTSPGITTPEILSHSLSASAISRLICALDFFLVASALAVDPPACLGETSVRSTNIAEPSGCLSKWTMRWPSFLTFSTVPTLPNSAPCEVNFTRSPVLYLPLVMMIKILPDRAISCVGILSVRSPHRSMQQMSRLPGAPGRPFLPETRGRSLVRRLTRQLLRLVVVSAITWIVLVSRRPRVSCEAASGLSITLALESCEREFLQGDDPLTGARLAEAHRIAGDRAIAGAIANGLLVTTARADALWVLGAIALEDGRLEVAASALRLARDLHRADGRPEEAARDDRALRQAELLDVLRSSLP